jgi:glycosyltransferase involved in cell wall biosynthesis
MGERSRILVIDKTGGLSTSQERFEALAGDPDFDLHVLCPGFWKEHGLRFTAEPGPNSRYTVHTGTVRFPGYYARSFYTRGLGAALRAVRPHLIHLLEEPYSLFSLQTLILRNRICPHARVVFYTWENIYRDFRYPARIQSIYRYADRRMHREASAAFCATADAAEVLKRKGFRREIRVIPYGVESLYLDRLDDDGPLRPEGYPFIIGFVGRLLEMKGVDLLVRALPGLADARLHLVGSGPQRDRLRDLAESLGVADRVRFFGPVPSDEVRRSMEAFTVLVLPSRTTRWWSEQLGRCLLEAMALGIPVVAARSGSIPRVVNDAGLLFPEDDVDTLVAQLIELRRRPELVRRLVRAGKERVRTDYTWEVFARRSHAFYRRILGLPS